MIREDEILKKTDNRLNIQVDDTSDVSTKGRLSVIARLDKGSNVYERLGFVDVSPDRSATAVSAAK